jgi:hypothetical protein
MNNQPLTAAPKTRRSSLPLLILLVGLVLVALALLFRRDILDWLALRNYQAPAAIAALAADDTMTSQANKIFYVNHPQIDSKSDFKSYCSNRTEQTIVLGCYHGDQQGIYLLEVSDARLNGVEEVTAAHEMLHAAYDRLSGSERRRIDGLLQDYYDNGLKDERIKTTVDSYRQTEPNDVVNEMHSIFGTEVRNLPPALETYYKQYFNDRQKIVTYAEHYSAEFTSRRAQVAAYDDQLSRLKNQINASTASLKRQEAQLSDDRSDLEAMRGSGNTTAYNAAVPTYNSEVRAYNAMIAETKAMIAQYNDIVEKRNEIALEVQQLAQAISGDTVPNSK